MTKPTDSSNDGQEDRPYDLEERTAVFGEGCARLTDRGEAALAGSERVAFDLREDLSGVRSVRFGFGALGFFRAWVFRHSDSRAHYVA